jgi:hypothetical protein
LVVLQAARTRGGLVAVCVQDAGSGGASAW